MKSPVCKTSCPPDSIVHSYLSKTDFEDAYCFRLTTYSGDMQSLYLQLFNRAPLWVEWALRFRNQLVAPFGLKTEIEQQDNPSLEEGQKTGIFRIYKILENEIIAGEDDKHLDFRVSLFRSQEASPLITVTTIVQYHNPFGRAYMRLIMPFHKMVVKSILEGAVKRIKAGEKKLQTKGLSGQFHGRTDHG